MVKKKFAGAKDCGSFLRSRVSHNFPLPDSITCEGIFNEHYFTIPPTDTEIFHVTLSSSSSLDPISGHADHFLCLSGSSKYDGSGLRQHGGRPHVELVFVLDVSGSMGSGFQEVTLKQARQGSLAGATISGTKLDAAKEALIGLLDNMKDGDSFGLITFTTNAQVIIPLQRWSLNNKDEIIAKIKALKEGGGTELLCGLQSAVYQYEKMDEAAEFQEESKPKSVPAEESPGKGKEMENVEPLRRVFYLTDMLINSGNASPLLKGLDEAAHRPRPIHSTIIGFGVDFDVSMTNYLAKVPACNYFSVNSASEFLHQMTWEFDYLVFPIAQNITVSLRDPKAAKVLALCGSPTPLEDLSEGVLMYSSASFPSQTQGKAKDSTKGGVILAKLSLSDSSSPLEVTTSFISWDGTRHESVSTVTFQPPQHHASLAARKGVLLSRYVALTRTLLKDIHSNVETPSITADTGILYDLTTQKKGNARNNARDVPPCLIGYVPLIRQFLAYYDAEAALLDDTELGLWRTALEDYLKKAEKEKEKENGGEELVA